MVGQTWLDSLLCGVAALVLAQALNATYGDAQPPTGFAQATASLLEGITMLHVTDATPEGNFHGANPPAWLPRTLAWCAITLPCAAVGAEAVRARFALAGLRASLASNVAAIVLLAVFGRVAHERCVLYVSLHSLFYRSLEFTVGVHLEALYAAEDVTCRMCLRVFAALSERLLLALGCAWVLNIGRTYVQEAKTLCARMYAFDTCLPPAWPVPLPGVALGCVLVADSLQTHLCVGSIFRLRRCCTAMFWAWPVCQTVRLAAAVNFEPGSASGNEAFLNILSAAALGLFVPAYHTLQPYVFRFLYVTLCRAPFGPLPPRVRVQLITQGDLSLTEYEEDSD